MTWYCAVLWRWLERLLAVEKRPSKSHTSASTDERSFAVLRKASE
jgi:hypothetical protein